MKRVLLCLGCGLLSLALALGLAACGGGQTAVPTASPSQPRETPAPAETPEPAVYDDSLIADAYADAGDPATEWDGTLEYVDLFRCVRYETYVCGGPLYGVTGVTALSAGIEEKTDYSYATVYAHDASGRRRGLLETAYLGGGLPYELAKSFGAERDDGAWLAVRFDAELGVQAQCGEAGFTGFPLYLGMSADGLICALDFWDGTGGETLSVCALLPGDGMLVLTQLAGGSPFGLMPGETLLLPENYG